MKKIFIAFAMILLYHSVNAQNKIIGKISDKDNSSMFGVNIFLPEINKGTTSDENGNYEISNLPNGKFKIQFSFLGYKNVVQIIELHNETKNFDVQLISEIIETQEVVVSGFLINSQHENAIKIDVLKAKEILLSGTSNFMESITKIPGVDMISKGIGVSKPVIRGLSMNDILVLNNGVKIENYQYSENHPLGVDENSIERIEIIKGPASLLYGSDAIGGVLNFVKEKPAPTNTIQGFYKTQFHSNTLGYCNSFGIKGASQHFFAGLNLNQKSHSDYRQADGIFVPNSRFNELSLSSNLGNTGAKGTSKLYYDYFKQNLGMTVPAIISTITEQARKNEIWFQDLEHHLISSQNKMYFENIKWETNIAFQSAIRKLITTTEEPFVEMNLNTISYNSKLMISTGKNFENIVGIQGSTQQNRNRNDRISQFLPDANMNNIGILALSQFEFKKKLKIQGGLRFDIFNINTFELGTIGTEGFHKAVSKQYSSINGSIGATYNVNEKLIFRANFAKAYRVPTLSELTSAGMHGNRYEIGNENLKPENAYETDFSTHFHGEYISFDVAGFYNLIDDYIFITPSSDTTSSGLSIYKFSQSNANLYGAELGIHFHPKFLPCLHIQGNYSSVIGEQENGNFLPFIPAQKFRYEIRIEKEKIGFLKHLKLKISALTALQQNNFSVFETSSDGYTIFNIGFSSDIVVFKQTIDFGISVNNVFDTKYIDHLSTLKPMNFNNIGRNIAISLKIPF